jgi:glycine/D-amino acid oxidase-like deaminating enzyme
VTPRSDHRGLSLWWDTLPAELVGPARPPLPGHRDADVAIVGGGYTGLWTAYWLAKADPTLRVVVLEREVAGFGASGRNGGWCSALFPASIDKVARGSSRGAAVDLWRALFATVDEVGAVAAAEGIDCHWAKGGTLHLARTPEQWERARAEVAHARHWGFGEEHVRLLSGAEAAAEAGATGLLGATFTPHCAAIHPARLVRGLALAAERLGVTIYEGTAVTSLEPGLVRTEHGVVRAPYVVRATEGYTPGLPGHERALAPVYSLVIATEPLPDAAWREIGLAGRATFNDLRHLIVYGQRTADGRLVFGGRGAPYHFGSSVRPEHDREPRVFTGLQEVLADFFPAVAGAAITHRWGGPLGIPRDWFASVGLDRRTGLAWGGGYVGDGVGAAHLAGRTLADLILERDTDRVRLPWVNHRSPRWEPEPLRWMGVNAGLQAMSRADGEEARRGKQSLIAQTFSRLIGG